MKKSILAVVLLLCLCAAVVACTPNNDKDETKTNEKVTNEQGSVVTNEQGDPETYLPEETTAGESGDGEKIENAGDNTDASFGEFIPVG